MDKQEIIMNGVTVELSQKYLFVNSMSQKRIVGETKDILSEVQKYAEEIIELRCFGDGKEIYAKSVNGETLVRILPELIISNNKNKPLEEIDQTHHLMTSIDNRTSKSQVVIRRYVTYDEDGQAMIIGSQIYDLV